MSPERTGPTEPAHDTTRFEALRSVVQRHVRQLWPEKPPLVRPDVPPPRTFGRVVQRLMRTVPWALGVVFVFSLFWDFEGIALAVANDALLLVTRSGEHMLLALSWLPVSEGTLPLEGLLLIVSSSGLIGFLTNWVAITLLFRPRTKHPILGQGLIPAQRDVIVVKLAEAVDEGLIGPEVIKQGIQDSGLIDQTLNQVRTGLQSMLSDPDFQQEVRSVIQSYLRGIIGKADFRKKLADFTVDHLKASANSTLGGFAVKSVIEVGKVPLMAAVEAAIARVPDGLDPILDAMFEKLDLLPAQMEARHEEIEEWATGVVLRFVENLDIYTMVKNQLQSFDEGELEGLIKQAGGAELDYIKYLGGILGVIGGLVIFERWLALPALALAALILVGLDASIMALSGRYSDSSPRRA